jgi:hypothetical protein
MMVMGHMLFSNGEKEKVDISYYGDTLDFKRQYQYVHYADKYFELQMYDNNGFYDYDMEAYYSEIDWRNLPFSARPQPLHRPWQYRKRCECGAASVKSSRHSTWCPRFVQEGDT